MVSGMQPTHTSTSSTWRFMVTMLLTELIRLDFMQYRASTVRLELRPSTISSMRKPVRDTWKPTGKG